MASNVRVYHSDSFKVIYMGSGAPTPLWDGKESTYPTNTYPVDPDCKYMNSQIYKPTVKDTSGKITDYGNPKPNPFTIQYIDENTGSIYTLRRPVPVKTGPKAGQMQYTWTFAWE